MAPAALAFEASRDPKARRAGGAHYTNEENILKTLNPLFLDDLRTKFDDAHTEVSLRALRTELGAIRFLDPSCGCGNFLVVAYRELRHLELRILAALPPGTDPAPVVTPGNFYGIEIDAEAARAAEAAFADEGQLPHIVVGNALTFDWADLLTPSANVIVAGNPPFLGISLRSAEQTAELKQIWGANYHGTLDYVTGWHACALRFFDGVNGRWAFVTTNSIVQGEAVAPLFRPILSAGWTIAFAHRTFKWTSEATGQAAVHCVVIGFEREPATRRLFDYPTLSGAPMRINGVKNITPYLTVGASVLVDPASTPLNPQMGVVSYGNKPTDGGWLIVEEDALEAAKADPIAAKYLRPFVGARELLHGGTRHCLWLERSTPEERSRSPFVAERVARRRAFLESSKAAATKSYADSAHLFRQISQPSVPYLCIPAHVSESRPYFLTAYFAPDVITSNANFLSEDPDGLTFAVVSSTMFIVWQRTVGGRIKSDLRFNKFLSWNTFPLPPLSDAERAAIVAAGKSVLAARGTMPLAEMYRPGELDPELQSAHDDLDRAVDAAFGVQPSTELERQDILFARYLRYR